MAVLTKSQAMALQARLRAAHIGAGGGLMFAVKHELCVGMDVNFVVVCVFPGRFNESAVSVTTFEEAQPSVERCRELWAADVATRR